MPSRKQIEIAPDLPANAAFQSIASACLQQIVANRPAIMRGDPAGVHLMRVGLRRLRTALALLSDVAADPAASDLKRELKWLTAELGPARELDVFLAKVVTPLGEQHRRLSGMRLLSRELADQRDAAAASARAAVSSRRYRELTRHVADWIETGGWRQPRRDPARHRGAQSIEKVARAQLKRRWKQLRKRGRQLAQLDPHARHRLRIRAKQLRYATEFYKTLFSRKKQAKRRAAFLSDLKHLQDCLGELNDIAVHGKLTEGILQARATPAARPSRRKFAAGLLAGHEQARFKPLLASAERAFGALEQRTPYWK